MTGSVRGGVSCGSSFFCSFIGASGWEFLVPISVLGGLQEVFGGVGSSI